MVTKAKALAELHSTIDDAVAEDLSDISDRVKSETDIATTTVSVVFAVALLTLLIVLTGIIRSITRPMRSKTRVMEALAKGDLTVDVPYHSVATKSADGPRIGVSSRTRSRPRHAARAAEQAQQMKNRRQAAMDRHTEDFATTTSGVMSGLAHSADTMRGRANDMASAVNRTQVLASETADSATMSAQNLTAVAAAAEEMAASINEIGRQVTRAADAVRFTVDRATETDNKVGGLVIATDKVGDVVRLIF